MPNSVLPPIVTTYFDFAAQPDPDPYLALFADNAVVEDEGKTYRGIEEIRSWRASTPAVTYDITSVEAEHPVVVTCTVSGDFPGSPFAGLRFYFEDFDDAQIRVLRIRP